MSLQRDFILFILTASHSLTALSKIEYHHFIYDVPLVEQILKSFDQAS